MEYFMYCMTCGKAISDDSVFCTYCGCRTDVFINSPQQNSAAAAEQKEPDVSELRVDAKPEVPDKISAVKLILSILVPEVGIIFGVKSKNEGKMKSGKVYLIVGIVVLVLHVMLGLYVVFYLFVSFWSKLLETMINDVMSRLGGE